MLYLCLEDTFRQVQNRLYQLTGVGPDNLRFAVMSKQISLGLEAQLEEYLALYPKTGLLIIDTLQKVRDSKGANGRNGMYGGDYDDMSAVKLITDRHNIAIVLVHHLRKMKDSRDPFNEVSGSTGLLGAADTMLLLKKDSRMADTATLTANGRDIQGLQFILRLERFVWQVVERKDSAALHMDEVPAFLFALVDFMRVHGEWASTATELLSEDRLSLGDDKFKSCLCGFLTDTQKILHGQKGLTETERQVPRMETEVITYCNNENMAGTRQPETAG